MEIPTRILLSAAILFGIAVAGENSVRDVTYNMANNCPQGGCNVPGFDKGYLFEPKQTLNAPPDGLTVFDPTGKLMYRVDITAPDGSRGHLTPRAETYAADTDGTVLVPIHYGGYGGNGHVKGGGLVVLDQEGKQIRFVDTDRFLPDAACFGPDHSIWAMGTQYAPLHAGESADHIERGTYNLVRKYSPDGKLIGSFLPRSLFPPGMEPAEGGWMRASHDRVGVMTYPGEVSDHPEWVELDLDGRLTGRWKLGPLSKSDPDTHNTIHSLDGFAFTSDGRLYAGTTSCPALHHCSYQLMILDRDTVTWMPAGGGPIERSHYLMAADGNDLVIEDRSRADSSGVHLVWVRADQPH